MERETEMDKIKGFINDLTGGDGKLDANDLKNVDVNELHGMAEQAGLGDLSGKLESLGIGKVELGALSGLNFPLGKDEIISALKSAGVNDQLLSLLEKVPDQVYASLEELQKKLPI